jgi:polar amino acid transport system substrate-binding protein
MPNNELRRRDIIAGGGLGIAAASLATTVLNPKEAAAQSSSDSLLRRVLDRGTVRVGTGSTNAPWHFEDENGRLVGMDIAMARILAKGLFDDPEAVEFVQQDPAARIPNINTGKCDIVIQFMTINEGRAQLVAFSRPYYVESISFLTRPDGEKNKYEKLLAAGSDAKVSILQNVDAEEAVHKQLPKAKVLMLDTQANVIQALDSGRVDAAAVDLSTTRWLKKRRPERYEDSGHRWFSMLYGAAVKQGDPNWLTYVNTVFNVAIYGHRNEIYDKAFFDFFAEEIPNRKAGFPPI